jgi:nucleoid-associated protein YgaU
MSLIGKTLAVFSAVALVLTTIVLTMPPTDRPARIAPKDQAQSGAAIPSAGESDTAADLKHPAAPQSSKLDAQEGSTPSAEASPDTARGSGPDALVDVPLVSNSVETTYVVRAGDTPATIAKQQLGSASRWQDIARANPGLEARSLQIGQILRLPGAISPTSMTAPDAAVPEKHHAPAAVGAVGAAGAPLATHRVAQGDSLYQLARKYYGDGSRWTLIRDANPSLEGNGVQGLRLDSELVIPALTGPNR